jgi:hypothetical protein
MTKKWMAINVLLLMITGLFGWRLYLSILRFDADNDLSKIQPVQDMKQKIVPEKTLPKLPPKKNYIPAEFAIVPEKSIFSESRSRDENTDVVALPESQPLTQKPILVGVNIADDQQTALIIDPTSPSQERNRRAQTKRVGDVYHGYTITSIALDQIVLESGAQKEIIPLHEGSKKTQGGKTPIVATQVVSFGGNGVAGDTAIVVSSRSANVAQSRAATGAAPAAAGQPIAVRQVVSASAQKEQSTQAQSAQSAQSAQPPSGTREQVTPNTGSESPKMRVIRTPFGTVVRPVRD